MSHAQRTAQDHARWSVTFHKETWRDRVGKEHVGAEPAMRQIIVDGGYSFKSQEPAKCDFCVENIPVEVFGPMDTETGHEHDIWKLGELLKDGRWYRALWFYTAEIIKQPNLVACALGIFVRLGFDLKRKSRIDISNLSANIILEELGLTRKEAA